MTTDRESKATLGEELPREMARVLEILPVYVDLGTSGALAAALMRSDLDRAVRAMLAGDVVAMLRAYLALKAWEL